MNPSDAAVVRRSIIVDAPIKHAFSVFTGAVRRLQAT